MNQFDRFGKHEIYKHIWFFMYLCSDYVREYLISMLYFIYTTHTWYYIFTTHTTSNRRVIKYLIATDNTYTTLTSIRWCLTSTTISPYSPILTTFKVKYFLNLYLSPPGGGGVPRLAGLCRPDNLNLTLTLREHKIRSKNVRLYTPREHSLLWGWKQYLRDHRQEKLAKKYTPRQRMF